jgi:hypothetical protein
MEEPSLLRLAERLFSVLSLGKVKLLVGQVPEHWPSTIPLIENAQVVGSATYPPDKVRVLFETQLSPTQVLAAYQQAITSQGDEFLTVYDAEYAGLGRCNLRGEDLLDVRASKQEGGDITYGYLYWIVGHRVSNRQRTGGLSKRQRSVIPINFQRTDNTSDRQVSGSPLEAFQQSLSSQIPLAFPPPDAPQWYLEMQNFRGGDARGQFALFRGATAVSSSEVLEYFAQQLARIGWQRVAQEDGEASICITWRIPRQGGPTDAWGALWMLDCPGRDDQKVMVLRVKQAA